ncbi:hypothetical protein [Haloquadratum walsbyi]|nr:hypothetical protein [Haloquadratum walsbyi]
MKRRISFGTPGDASTDGPSRPKRAASRGTETDRGLSESSHHTPWS